MKLIDPDHGQAMCTQGMESVVDRDFRRTLLMGSMSVSCLSGSSSIYALRPSTGQVRMR
jgi:hypothetical protein